MSLILIVRSFMGPPFSYRAYFESEQGKVNVERPFSEKMKAHGLDSKNHIPT
jgi:hypothetical protein